MTAGPVGTEPRRARSAPARLRVAAGAAGSGFLGLLPHALHHVGPLAGAALFAGAGGSLLFGALGLVAALPFLIKVRRRSGGWRMPGILLAVFVVMFAISTFVIGPELRGDGAGSGADPRPAGHDRHH